MNTEQTVADDMLSTADRNTLHELLETLGTPEQPDLDQRTIALLVRKLAATRDRIADREAIADDEHQRINDWLADVTHGDRQLAERIEQSVATWAKAARTHATKSWEFPAGRVATRTVPARVVVADGVTPEAVAAVVPEAVETVVKVRMGDVKRNVRIVNGQPVLTSTGELVDTLFDVTDETVSVKVESAQR